MKEMKEEKRYPLEEMRKIAEEIKEILKPYCEEIYVAGSVRRKKPTCKDIEFVYVPKEKTQIIDLFNNTESLDLIDDILCKEPFGKRLNKNGSTMYGTMNKLLIYNGIPVDIFRSSKETLPMTMVIRTGGWQMNRLLAVMAMKKNLKLKHIEGGYEDKDGNLYICKSERDVFEHIGLEYLEPEERSEIENYSARYGIVFN